MTNIATAPPPPFEHVTLTQRDGESLSFEGQLLGAGTSKVPGKQRWFEINIYRKRDGSYVVHTIGMSLIDGESPLVRIIMTTSAFEIISVLVVNHNNKTYIPRQSDRALAQAAHWDDDIRDAYINRAVL
jgi:hypothetical protein